ncbi:hypothetical protein L7F22_058135 [Adiantum nelumboides]|nr:hypothetical protein [Adiantum nelumboides]
MPSTLCRVPIPLPTKSTSFGLSASPPGPALRSPVTPPNAPMTPTSSFAKCFFALLTAPMARLQSAVSTSCTPTTTLHIHNDDYLYLCSLTFNLCLIPCNASMATENGQLENIRHYRVWHDIAVHMGIHNIPMTLPAFAQFIAHFKDEYEAKHMVYHPNNQELVEAGMQLLLDQMPKLFRLLVLRIALPLLDKHALAAVDYRL